MKNEPVCIKPIDILVNQFRSEAAKQYARAVHYLRCGPPKTPVRVQFAPEGKAESVRVVSPPMPPLTYAHIDERLLACRTWEERDAIIAIVERVSQPRKSLI
jgi:hypothetical protein